MAALLPFRFSLLHASRSRPVKTLMLITNMPPSLPLYPAIPADYIGNALQDMPDWVVNLCSDQTATRAWKVMDKEIYASDVSDQQNRFMIRSQPVADMIMPNMTEGELMAANLMTGDLPTKKRSVHDAEEEAGERKRGRDHGGLPVMVYNRYGWGCLLCFTRWDASKCAVLKGGNYKEFHRRSYFAVGDVVDVWAFRGVDGKLFFGIGSRINVELSL